MTSIYAGLCLAERSQNDVEDTYRIVIREPRKYEERVLLSHKATKPS
jgi:FtsZ-interacting cell division protein YlmF